MSTLCNVIIIASRDLRTNFSISKLIFDLKCSPSSSHHVKQLLTTTPKIFSQNSIHNSSKKCRISLNYFNNQNIISNNNGRRKLLSSLQQFNQKTNSLTTQTKFKQKKEVINLKNVNNNNPSNEWTELMKLPLVKRLNVMLKKYWYIAIPFHCANCAVWFASFFLLAKFGMNGAAVINWIKPYVIESSICPQFMKNLFEKDPDKLGSVAIALLFYKLATPGRYATTVLGTIYLLRYMLKKGIIIKTANEQLNSVRNSYISHAVNRNIQKQRERIMKQMKNVKAKQAAGNQTRTKHR